MKTFGTGLLAALAGTLLLAVSGGLVSAQTPSRAITEAPASRSNVGVEGRYCPDASRGHVWVAEGTQLAGTYCPPTPPPAYTPPPFPSSMPDDPDLGGSGS